MIVAIDFGISNTDVAIINNGKTIFHSSPSNTFITNESLIKILHEYNLKISDIEVIGVTGG